MTCSTSLIANLRDVVEHLDDANSPPEDVAHMKAILLRRIDDLVSECIATPPLPEPDKVI